MSLLSLPNNQRIISKYVQTKLLYEIDFFLLTLYIKVLCYKHTILSLEDAIAYMTIWFPFHLVFFSKLFYIKCESMDHLSNHLIPVFFLFTLYLCGCTRMILRLSDCYICAPASRKIAAWLLLAGIFIMRGQKIFVSGLTMAVLGSAR